MILPSASFSVTRPVDIPAQGAEMGTPASISDRQPPQIEAIEVDPLELITSETTRIAYGNSSSGGRIGRSERSASAPCPCSRRLVKPKRPASPVENGGKL